MSLLPNISILLAVQLELYNNCLRCAIPYAYKFKIFSVTLLTCYKPCNIIILRYANTTERGNYITLNTKRLKARMVECGLTQKDVAEFLKMAPATVSQKLNGIRPLCLDEAEKLAVKLNIKHDDFGHYFFT